MTTSAPLESWRSIISGLFPWLAYVEVAKDGGLSLRAAAAKLLHLQGDAGDPAALTTADTAGTWLFDPGIPGSVAPALYRKAPGGAAYVVVAMVTPGSTVGGTVPPLPATVGTAIGLGPGSSTVTVRP